MKISKFHLKQEIIFSPKKHNLIPQIYFCDWTLQMGEAPLFLGMVLKSLRFVVLMFNTHSIIF